MAHRRSGSSSTVSRSNWNMEMLVFWREKKTGVPGEKSFWARMRTSNKRNPHVTPITRIESRPHCLEASALATAPWLLPLSILHDRRRYLNCENKNSFLWRAQVTSENNKLLTSLFLLSKTMYKSSDLHECAFGNFFWLRRSPTLRRLRRRICGNEISFLKLKSRYTVSPVVLTCLNWWKKRSRFWCFNAVILKYCSSTTWHFRYSITAQSGSMNNIAFDRPFCRLCS